jgi:hypothetical protein
MRFLLFSSYSLLIGSLHSDDIISVACHLVHETENKDFNSYIGRRDKSFYMNEQLQIVQQLTGLSYLHKKKYFAFVKIRRVAENQQ